MMPALLLPLCLSGPGTLQSEMDFEWRWDLVDVDGSFYVAVPFEHGWRLTSLQDETVHYGVGLPFNACGNVTSASEGASSRRVVFEVSRMNSMGLRMADCELGWKTGQPTMLEMKDSISIHQFVGIGPAIVLPPLEWSSEWETLQDHDQRTLHDLRDPVLVPGQDGVFLLFSGSHWAGSRRQVWIADLAKRDGFELRDAVYLGEGNFPRHCRSAGRSIVVALSNEGGHDGRRRGRALLWYSSEDLVTWTDHGEVDPERSYASFDLALVDGRPVIAATQLAESGSDVVGYRLFGAADELAGWTDLGLRWAPSVPARFRLLPDGRIVRLMRDGESIVFPLVTRVLRTGQESR